MYGPISDVCTFVFSQVYIFFNVDLPLNKIRTQFLFQCVINDLFILLNNPNFV